MSPPYHGITESYICVLGTGVRYGRPLRPGEREAGPARRLTPTGWEGPVLSLIRYGRLAPTEDLADVAGVLERPPANIPVLHIPDAHTLAT